VLGGIVAGLFATSMIVSAAAGPNCCTPGDGLLGMFWAMILVPLCVALSILIVATVLRVKRKADK